jgi:hypothetical protein
MRCLPALEIEAQRVIRTVLVTVIKKQWALLMSERFYKVFDKRTLTLVRSMGDPTWG